MNQWKLLISLVRDAPFMWEKRLKANVEESIIENCWENIGSCLDPTLTGPEARDIFEGLEHSFSEYNEMNCFTDHSKVDEATTCPLNLELYNALYFLQDQTSTQANAHENTRKQLEKKCSDSDVYANCKEGLLREEILGEFEHKFNNVVGLNVLKTPENSNAFESWPDMYSRPSTSKALDPSGINPIDFIDLTNNSSSDCESVDSMTDCPILERVNGGFEVKVKKFTKKIRNSPVSPTLASSEKLNVSSSDLKFKMNSECSNVESDDEYSGTDPGLESSAVKKIKVSDSEDNQLLAEILVAMAENTLGAPAQLSLGKFAEPVLKNRSVAAALLIVSALSSLPEAKQILAITLMLEVVQRLKTLDDKKE